MERMIDDSVKQKLLDELSNEPTMVISTAYAYAKNYVNYGEDITKVWTTAVQQSSILEKVRQKAWKEAYDSFKAEQEPRTGHWIMTSDYLTTAYGSIDYVECSCCGEDSLEEGDYCPNCGARMIEPQESEGK